MADELTRAPLDETAERIREYLADHPDLLYEEFQNVEDAHPLCTGTATWRQRRTSLPEEGRTPAWSLGRSSMRDAPLVA